MDNDIVDEKMKTAALDFDDRTINLGKQGLEDIPEWIDEIDGSWHTVDLSSNNLTHLKYSSLIDKMEQLFLSNNDLESIDEKYRFPNLTHVTLDNNKFREIPQPVMNAPSLNFLDCKNNLIDKISTSNLISLIGISHVDLTGNGVNITSDYKALMKLGKIVIDIEIVLQEIELDIRSIKYYNQRGMFGLCKFEIKNYDRLWTVDNRLDGPFFKRNYNTIYENPYYPFIERIKENVPESVVFEQKEDGRELLFILKSSDEATQVAFQRFREKYLNTYVSKD